MQTLAGKTVVITGAASGIGRALAVRCATLGARLAIADLDEGGLAEAARIAGELGAEADATRLDVADRDAIYRWAAHVEERFGGADVVVNNAGVSLSHSIERMRDEDFDWLFRINFWGVVHGCKAFLPQLRARPEAHIVNVSSMYGLIGVPTHGAYNASKFAVRGYTEALRQELRPTRVRVTCVYPGMINTNLVRNGRHYETIDGEATTATETAMEFERIARTSPESAARAITGAILRGRERLLIGADAHMFDLVARLLPTRYDRLVALAGRAARRARRRR